MSRTSEVGATATRLHEAGQSSDAASVSVGIVDDDAIVRAWVRMSFENTEFLVAGEAKTAAEALSLVERRRPQLLLVDYGLPDKSGTELVRMLRAQGERVPVLVITATPRKGLTEMVREAGAQGVVLKRSDPDEMLASLRRVASGLTVVDTSLPRRDTFASLSPRECEVLRRVADGFTNAEIAESLGVGFESVKTLLRRAFVKLGVRNRVEAVREARRRGLL